ncbi:MAG: SGNH/GDSL hydrolase family protein [Oscillospiraceae bacterium]|nr:SGNH/GDSL hydrolase family protein [Oscillospiraceae bacterium]
MKVLFIGNSHTYYNDMPQIFADICKERGKDVEVTMQAHPGVTYGWHFGQHTELRFALVHGGFDYIVMQQAAHSPCPAKEETIADGKKIIELARANGVTPIQTMPWAEKRDPDHQKGMYDIYNTLAEETGVKLTVAGNVFEDVFYNYPDVNLYWRDGEHASPYGSYVIAMAAYAAIFGESVKGLAPKSYETFPISEETWAEIRDAFAEVAAAPNDPEVAARAMEKYKRNVKSVDNKEEARCELDPEKAALLQELVDKFAFGK